MSPTTRTRLMLLALGLALIGGGAAIFVPPLISRAVSITQVSQRAQTDSAALKAWRTIGSDAIAGAPLGDTTTVDQSCPQSGSDSQAIALVRFTSLPQYAYVGVAGDGTWDLLHQRSMVHYVGTPAPGQRGNVIIAFHREPNYEHIDQLDVGQRVDIVGRDCRTYTYTVKQRWNLPPSQVTQLNATTGFDLTLITCTPFWQDYNRLVWRATLTAIDGVPAPQV